MVYFKLKQRPRNESCCPNLHHKSSTKPLPQALQGRKTMDGAEPPGSWQPRKKQRGGSARARISVENHTAASCSEEFLRMEGADSKTSDKSKNFKLSWGCVLSSESTGLWNAEPPQRSSLASWLFAAPFPSVSHDHWWRHWILGGSSWNTFSTAWAPNASVPFAPPD